MNITVRNARKGEYSPDIPSGYSSWLDYWEKHTNKTAGWCRYCRKEIPNKDLVGGHVKSITTGIIYITPLCASCNHPDNTSSFSVESEWLVKV